MSENKTMKEPLPVSFTDKGFINSKFLKQYDLEGQIYILEYMLRKEQWKIENDKIIFPSITNDIQMKQITKLQELDLKDFYFDIRTDEVNRCSLMGINSQLRFIQVQKKKIQDEKENVKSEIKENNLNNEDIEMEE